MTEHQNHKGCSKHKPLSRWASHRNARSFIIIIIFLVSVLAPRRVVILLIAATVVGFGTALRLTRPFNAVGLCTSTFCRLGIFIPNSRCWSRVWSTGVGTVSTQPVQPTKYGRRHTVSLRDRSPQRPHTMAKMKQTTEIAATTASTYPLACRRETWARNFQWHFHAKRGSGHCSTVTGLDVAYWACCRM